MSLKMAAYIMCNRTTSILKILTRGQRRLDKVMRTKYQTVELAEADTSLVPKKPSCNEGGELEMQAQECNQ